MSGLPDREREPEAVSAIPEAGVPDLLGAIVENTRLSSDKSQRQTFEQGLFELAQQLEAGDLPSYLTGDVTSLINSAIDSIDRRLSRQVDAVIHHEKFQKLEATWKNLHELVQRSNTQSDTGDDIKITVLNVTRRELERDLGVGTKKTLFRTGLFEKVHTSAFNTYGGHPFAALVGDLEFSHEARDVDLLKKLAGLAAAAHAPFLAAASPAMFGWSDFTEMAGKADLKVKFDLPQYDDWQSFRKHTDSRYVGLCLPHVLARMPYGPEGGEPVETFDYREEVTGKDHSRYLWGNAAYALAGRLVDSFTESGWCVSITGPMGGGRVDDLPLHSFKTDEGDVAKKCPTEVQISDDRDYALTKLGFIPLVHRKHEKYAVFNGAPSCHDPGRYTTPEGNSNAFLGAQLPYVMAVSRIAHYLKLIGREAVGSNSTSEQVRDQLQTWINNYVLPMDNATEDQRRRKPLREARIEVQETPGRPGYYQAHAFIRPHFKLEGLSAEVSVVADLPRKTNA